MTVTLRWGPQLYAECLVQPPIEKMELEICDSSLPDLKIIPYPNQKTSFRDHLTFSRSLRDHLARKKFYSPK